MIILNMLQMRAFLKKESKNEVFNAGKLGHFWKTATNHLTSTKCCDQTTSATNISHITVERQYPYLSFGTWFFEIYPGDCDDFLKTVASSGHFKYQEIFSNFH